MKQALFTCTLLVAGFTLSAQTPSTEDGLNRLHARASVASTMVEHADVAKQYLGQAARFDAEAKEREQKVATVAKQALFIKWPAMMPRWVQDEKQAALTARRSARECRELAAKHQDLAGAKQTVDADGQQ